MRVAANSLRQQPSARQAANSSPQPTALLAWYDRHRRVLPWRAKAGERPDPYRVWLSEVMLQQTTVKAVAPFYLRFLARWPNVEGLAEAPIDDVLKGMAADRAKLLLVLDQPEVPLHNNLSEGHIRDYVKKRKISGSTRNESGRRARDTFASLKKTCRRLGVNFYDPGKVAGARWLVTDRPKNARVGIDVDAERFLELLVERISSLP